MWQEESIINSPQQGYETIHFKASKHSSHHVSAVFRIANPQMVKSLLISQNISSAERLKSGKRRAPHIHNEKIMKNMTKGLTCLIVPIHAPLSTDYADFHKLHCAIGDCRKEVPSAHHGLVGSQAWRRVRAPSV
jgi:hypothetical protein